MPRRTPRTDNPDQLLTERPCRHEGECICGRSEYGTFEERKINDVVIIDLAGFFTGGPETERWDKYLQQLADSGNKKLLLNCERLDYLNSSGLGVLIRAHSNYRRRGGMMKLCSVDKRIENIFVITKLSLVFDVYPNEAEALVSFS